MSTEWKKLIGLLIVCIVPSTVCAELLCPGGEITLGPGRLRVVRTGSVSGTVASTRDTFALPAGVTIAPANEPIVFALEADRRPVGAVTLAAGELVARSAGKRFTYRVGGSSLSLRRARGAYQLSARFGDFDLTGLDFAQPPTFLKQILKIGDDCFASVLACTGSGDDLLCKTDRTVLLAGRVERSARAPLPGAMVTLIDDARLETVSVFAQEDGRFVFPRLRPGPYRLRARLIGYDDALTDVTLAKGRVTRVGLTMSPTANTNDQLPASAWFSLLLRQVAGPEDPRRLHALVRQLPPDRGLSLPPRQDRGPVADGPGADDDQPAALLPGDARPPRPERDRHLRPERAHADPTGPAAAVGRRAESRHLRVHPRGRDQQPGLSRPGARGRRPRVRRRGAPLDRSAHERARRLSVRRWLALDRARARRQHVDHPGGQRQPRRGLRRRRHAAALLPAAAHRRRPGRVPAHAALRLPGSDLDDDDEVEPRRALRPADGAVDVPSAAGRRSRRGRPLHPRRLRLRHRARRLGLVVAALRRAHRPLGSGDEHDEGVAAAVLRAAPAARRSGRHRVGAGLRLGRPRPLRSGDRAVEGLPAAHRPVRHAVQSEREPPRRPGVDQRLRLRHADPLRAGHRTLHRVPTADARQLHARDRVRSRQQPVDLHLERDAGAPESPAAASS